MSLAGQHDFTSFCAAECESVNPVCSILDARWIERDGELTFEIESNHFLQHMVRTIVGTLVEVGRGRWDRSRMDELLEVRDRRKAGPTAAAHGLYLAEVRYGTDEIHNSNEIRLNKENIINEDLH
jgi:tRNA pseudouridine38-40 synthase